MNMLCIWKQTNSTLVVFIWTETPEQVERNPLPALWPRNLIDKWRYGIYELSIPIFCDTQNWSIT